MELSNILMWIFVVIMIIGIWLSYRTINEAGCYVNVYEGPIVVAVGLLCSILVGMLSGGKTSEGFKTVYGLN